MRRHLPRLLLTGALLSPVTLYALGLGEIRLNSALNQPFDAEIELLSPTAEELGSLKVTLASNDVFSRYGIDRPAYLSNFDFAVSRNRDGKATIRVTSNRSVTEPYVTLLVEASWARGRLVREYTVLLDPPTMAPVRHTATAAPVSAPTEPSDAETVPLADAPPPPEMRETPEPEPVAEAPETPPPATEPAAEAEPEPVASEPEPAPEAPPAAAAEPVRTRTDNYGLVQEGETLWQIAQFARPDDSVTMNQMMLPISEPAPGLSPASTNTMSSDSVAAPFSARPRRRRWRRSRPAPGT